MLLPRRSSVLAALGALLASRAWAQPSAVDSAATEPASSLACVRALPASALKRSPVYVHAEVLDSADAAARPSVDVIAQEVALRVQRLLRGAVPDSGARMPPAIDSALGRVVYPEGRVRLVAHRGGRLAWRLDYPPNADTAAVALVGRALQAVHAESPLLVLDEAMRGDSVAFAIMFVHPFVGVHGRPEIRERNPTPAFTALFPAEKQAGLRRGLALRYPAELQQGGFEGKVVVTFVVDTAGRAEPRTFRDVHPEVVASLKPQFRRPYALFVGAVREGVMRAQFFPAEVGGCRVRQRVQQPVTFKLQR